MEEKIKFLVNNLGFARLKEDELLKYHTYNQLGGTADFFYIATTQRELEQILKMVFDLKIPYLILGNGTKLVLPENGFRGLVIKNRTGIIKIGGVKGKVSPTGIGVEEALVEVDSGVSINKLNEFLQKQHLRSLQGISSLHSSVGGSIFLDPVLQEQTQKIKIWEDNEIKEIESEELKRDGQVVLSVVLKIKAQ